MKKMILAGMASLLVICGVSASPAIPKEFHGKWIDKRSSCKNFEIYGAADPGIEITATEANQYEYPCRLKRAGVGNTPARFSGKFVCQGEGGEVATMLEFQKTAAGALVFGGHTLTVRCN